MLPSEGVGIIGSCFWIASMSATFIAPIMFDSNIDIEGSLLIFALINTVMTILIIIFMKETLGLN